MKRAGLVVGLLVSIVAGSTVWAQMGPQKQILPTAIWASADDGNTPIGAIDRDLKTRWSCLGATGCVLYVQSIFESYSGVGIRFWQNGKKARTSRFSVDISDDGGLSFYPVLAERDSPPDEQTHIYWFPPAFGYVFRINGFGNSQNAWNSIIEVELWAPVDHEG